MTTVAAHGVLVILVFLGGCVWQAPQQQAEHNIAVAQFNADFESWRQGVIEWQSAYERLKGHAAFPAAERLVNEASVRAMGQGNTDPRAQYQAVKADLEPRLGTMPPGVVEVLKAHEVLYLRMLDLRGEA